jgi:hypothetical protein
MRTDEDTPTQPNSMVNARVILKFAIVAEHYVEIYESALANDAAGSDLRPDPNLRFMPYTGSVTQADLVLHAGRRVDESA